MDLRALKSTDKTPLAKAPQDPTSFLCKIPVPIKSPKQKKAKRQITGKIVCSTPVNAVKRIIFEDDQQISPIRNPSSATSKASSSPIKIVDDVELENKLQVNKINKMDTKQESENSKGEIRDSVFPFPLIKNVKPYNMVLCDSDTDIFPQNVDSKNKRGRKSTRLINADKADTNTSTRKTNKIENTTSDTNIRKKNKINTTSDTEIYKRNKMESAKNTSCKTAIKSTSNIGMLQTTSRGKEKKNADSNISTIHTRSKSQTTSNESFIDEITDVENISENDTNKKKINSRAKSSSNSPKSKKHKTESKEIEIVCKSYNPDVLLQTRTEKIKKNILNVKTKSSINSKSNEIENNVDQNDDNSIFNEDVISSLSQVNNKTLKTNKNILNGKVVDKKETNLQDLDIVNIIKESEPKRKRKPETKNSEMIENSHDIRKSSRVRNPSSKYWLMNSKHVNAEQTEKNNKNAIKSPEELKTTDRSKKNKKTTKTSDKSKQIDELPVMNKILTKTPETINPDEPSTQLSKSTQSVQNYKKLPKKSNKPKLLTAGKIRKSLGLEPQVLKFISPRKTPKQQIKLPVSESDEYITEEENDIPKDTLLLNTETEAIQEFPSSEKGQKRKVDSNIEMYKPKKVRLQVESEYSFKKVALSADETPAKAGGLADVKINGRRFLLGCFGKFPRHYKKQNSDISVGVSINNECITTGVLEIEPAGKKKYECARKVDLLFLILEGRAQVGIGNSSQVLTLGQDFYVPRDTPYYIFNVTTDKLLVYFSKIHL